MIVQRARIGDGCAAFECRVPGETLSVLALATQSSLQLGIVPGKHRTLGTKLSWLEGARLLGVDATGALWFSRAERTFVLERAGAGLRLHPAPLTTEPVPLVLEALRANGPALIERTQRALLEAHRTAMRSRLSRAQKRLQRRAERIMGDLDKLDRLEQRAALAPLFLAAAAQAGRGQQELLAVDWSSGEPTEVRFALDPAKPARAQLEALFQRAKRAKRGRAIAEQRWEEASERQQRLAALASSVADADLETLGTLVQQAHSIAPKDFGLALPTRAREPQERAAPYREFLTERGASIYVGRGGEHNDTLTFRVARPHDLWLHTKDWPGAHVIVPLGRGKSAAPETVIDAAHLAAHFSEARGETLIAVQITERRHLRKPRGAPKGFVVVGKERVLELRVDAERLSALLASADS